jgi:hypothetical protein
MPVCKLSVRGGDGKGVRQVHRLDGKQPSTHLPLGQALGRPLEQGENYTILPCTDGDLVRLRYSIIALILLDPRKSSFCLGSS